MSVIATGQGARRARWARLVLWLVLPFLQLGYHMLAKFTAAAMEGVPSGLPWLIAFVTKPVGVALIVAEIASFVAWMIILSEIKLSEAFPASALSYILVILTGWFIFQEPVDMGQLVGAGLILFGVWLLGGSEEQDQ
jgi:multidrug transporter EmrE-like cation transporter